MVIFKTERLIVRHFSIENDVDNFFLINGDEEVMRYIRPVKNRVASNRFLQEQIAFYQDNPLMGRWAVEEIETGNFVGAFAFLPIEGTAMNQLGYALLKPFWGKGYATELMNQGIRHAFNAVPDNELFGISESANKASIRVLEKSGFVFQASYWESQKEIFRFVLKRPVVSILP